MNLGFGNGKRSKFIPNANMVATTPCYKYSLQKQITTILPVCSVFIMGEDAVCENWRLRGNDAYAKGNLSKAEEYYTRGVSSVTANHGKSDGAVTALTLCYSNRAAVRMSTGRMREALEDCIKATKISPLFHKALVRAAKCHLALGGFKKALRYFKKSLPQGTVPCLDRKLAIEASKGLEKAKKLRKYIDQRSELLRKKTIVDAEKALPIITEALLISPYSEKLLELNAETLLVLMRYEETIQLCEQSLDYATKNSSLESTDGSENINISHAKTWRWRMMAESYFYLGNLEEVLSLFEKLEQVAPTFKRKIPESLSKLAITARKLLCHKEAGMEAFQSGRNLEAVKHYTYALKCSQESRPFSILCLCNRASALQALGKIRASLDDFKKAADINPDLHEIQVRTANCYLVLGQIADALQHYSISLPKEAGLFLDRKLVLEASDGLLKAQQAINMYDRCGELLWQATSTDVEKALQLITKALAISPYSERLVKLKAEVLLKQLKYEEMTQLCEQSLDTADKNYYSASANGSENSINRPARLWRWTMIARAYFHLGRLEDALIHFEKLEQTDCAARKFGNKGPESQGTLAFTVRELLRHQAAGAEAFQSGLHLEAVRHFTCALSCNHDSRPFTATCFYDRAAAYQALGQITDAILECSVAIALVGNYPKAVSKRASLHELIRDYSQSAIDLQRLISEQKSEQSGKFVRSTSSVFDLTEAQIRLSTVKGKAKERIPLNMYLILGLDSTCMASDIKKAYRKAALRHHPDKVSHVFPRIGNRDNSVWKEIADVVKKDADTLFKLIGEAYGVLSDSVKRSKYDSEAEGY